MPPGYSIDFRYLIFPNFFFNLLELIYIEINFRPNTVYVRRLKSPFIGFEVYRVKQIVSH
jgi:hypothetical protein